jgi:hypothetical protein
MTKTKKIIACHQPTFLPHLGFFWKMAHCDELVILDDVQQTTGQKHNWVSRTKILLNEEEHWLTLPIQKKSHHQKIQDLHIDTPQKSKSTILKTLNHAYAKTPHFKEIMPLITQVFLEHTQPDLLSLNLKLIHTLKELFLITTPLRKSSEFRLKTAASQRLIDLTKSCGGQTYLSGSGASDYLDPHLFKKNDVTLKISTYKAQAYSQKEGSDFKPGLSSLDGLFYLGRNNGFFAKLFSR